MSEVTVVLPALHISESLRETILSAEQQEKVDIEILLVGPSRLRSATRGFPRTRLVAQEPSGLYKAMNAGVAEARGQWIMFLGEGDTYTKRTSVAELMENSAVGDEIVAGHTVIRYSEGNRKSFRAARAPVLRSKWGIPFGHPAAAHRRHLFSSVGLFDESFRSAGDFEWICRWLQRGARFKRINVSIVVARAGGLSTGPSTRALAIREESRVIQRYLAKAPGPYLWLSLLKLTLNERRLRGLGYLQD